MVVGSFDIVKNIKSALNKDPQNNPNLQLYFRMEYMKTCVEHISVLLAFSIAIQIQLN